MLLYLMYCLNNMAYRPYNGRRNWNKRHTEQQQQQHRHPPSIIIIYIFTFDGPTVLYYLTLFLSFEEGACIMHILVHYTRTYNTKLHILSISVLFFYYSNCSSSVHHLVLKVIALSINFLYLFLFSVSTCPQLTFILSRSHRNFFFFFFFVKEGVLLTTV